MLIFAYDFETNGLPLFDKPSEDPRQPHIVQAAAQLVDSETRIAIASVDLIAEPTDWSIPDNLARLHGISTERARAVGIPEVIIVQTLLAMWLKADVRLAHNESFDARIMRIGLKRFMGEVTAERWKAGEAECTQRMATPIVKAPPTEKMLAAGRKHHKSANLSEAFTFFTGATLENAHSAMPDVNACLAIYWAIQDGVSGDARASEFLPAKPKKSPAVTETNSAGPAADADEVSFL